jgi:opacity protein-like surface antigen
MKYPLLLLVSATLLSSAAWAQRVQNTDIYMLAGPAITSSSTIPGANVTVEATTGYASVTGYGYQIARTRGGSVWIDFSPAFVLPGLSGSTIGGSVNNNFVSFTLGLRFMVPIHSRIAIFGTVAGGGGSFNYPFIEGGTDPRVSSNSTVHGVFQFGGGVDFRLTKTLSIRGELRDYVTGSGLSGSTGPHHLVPLMGVAFHF